MATEVTKPIILDETGQRMATALETVATMKDEHMVNKENPHEVTKAQVGLSNVGNFKSVSTEASQGLSDTEKSNARSNIGVYSQDESDDRNLPTGGIYPSVDLGLPSGTLWAQFNVGGTSETDYGSLFAWGATEPYREGTDSTSDYSASKAATIQHDLYPNQDAATVHMGTGWKMPTKAQFDELLANTTAEWTSIGGVAGRKFTASNGNYVFFPASGYYNGSSVYNRTGYGDYWSRSFHSSSGAWRLVFYSGGQYTNASGRGFGFSVRGVRA